MTIQTFEKVQTFVQAIRFEGGRESAMEICRWVGNNSAYIPSTKEDPREYVQIPTMFGPRDMKVGEYVVRIDDKQYVTYKSEPMSLEFRLVEDEDHRLIQHARRELGMFPNEDPSFVESIVNAIKGFASYPGHSGSSAAIAVHMLTALLNGQNLLPLTDDPEEWEYHPKEKYGVDKDMWQNKRNSAAISYDEGKHYFLSNEMSEEGKPSVIYEAESKDFKPEIDPDDLLSPEEKYEETSCSVPGHRDGRVDEDTLTFYCPDCEAHFPLTRKVSPNGSDLS